MIFKCQLVVIHGTQVAGCLLWSQKQGSILDVNIGLYGWFGWQNKLPVFYCFVYFILYIVLYLLVFYSSVGLG